MSSTWSWIYTVVPPIERVFGARTGAALVVLLILGVRTCAAAECHAPSYRRGFVLEDSPSSITMNISIRMSDFTPERLVCLAKELRRRYADRKKIEVAIFSSHTAARLCTHPIVGDYAGIPPVDWSLQIHAAYSFDADRGEEAVDVMPYARRNMTGDSRIRLPVTSVPACKLQVSGRCLLALDLIQYPWRARCTKIPCTVAVEGVIARNGTVKNIRATGWETQPSETQGLLVAAAVESVKTWRFEPARQESPFRVAYWYMIEVPGGPSVRTDVRFDLPQKVEIRRSPYDMLPNLSPSR